MLEGRVIGTVNFEVDATTRTAMIGYAIGRVWWGRGIATEAVRAAMAWAIEAFALQRVWASTDAGNVRSQRVIEKLGMGRESVRVADHVGRDGKAVDEVVYGLDVATTSRRLARRSDEPIARLVDQVVALVKKSKTGLRSEEIKRALGLDRREVPRILKTALAKRKLRAKGQKRATTYSVG